MNGPGVRIGTNDMIWSGEITKIETSMSPEFDILTIEVYDEEQHNYDHHTFKVNSNKKFTVRDEVKLRLEKISE